MDGELLLLFSPEFDDIECSFESKKPSDFSKSEKNTLRKKKIEKYKWVVDALAMKMMRYIPEYTKAEYSDLVMEGYIALTKEISKFYKDDKLGEYLFDFYYDKKTNDVRVGPFFLKNLKNGSAKILDNDTASIKHIKGAMFDYLRKLDPLNRSDRSIVKKIDNIHDKETRNDPHRSKLNKTELIEKHGVTPEEYKKYTQAKQVKFKQLKDED